MSVQFILDHHMSHDHKGQFSFIICPYLSWQIDLLEDLIAAKISYTSMVGLPKEAAEATEVQILQNKIAPAGALRKGTTLVCKLITLGQISLKSFCKRSKCRHV